MAPRRGAGMLRSGGAGKKKAANVSRPFCVRVGAYWNSLSAWVIVLDTPHTSGIST